MRRVSWWLWFAACAQAILGLGATVELPLPSFTVGTNTYSNVVITASAKERVLIAHTNGIASARIVDLDLDLQGQLVEAGLVAGPLAKEITQAIDKREAAKRKAERKAARGPIEAPELSLESAEKESIANLLLAQAQAEADRNDLELDLEVLLGRFGALMIYGIAAGFVMLSFLRKYLFFRICKNATGEGSFFVFLPGVRWFVLADAARMSKQWLLVPTFAIAAAFLPPDVVNKFSWASIIWLSFLGALWLATAILYVVWCVQICRAVECSAWLAFVLILPGLDFLALFILAFAGSKADDAPLSVQLKKPILAI